MRKPSLNCPSTPAQLFILSIVKSQYSRFHKGVIKISIFHLSLRVANNRVENRLSNADPKKTACNFLQTFHFSRFSCFFRKSELKSLFVPFRVFVTLSSFINQTTFAGVFSVVLTGFFVAAFHRRRIKFTFAASCETFTG